MGASPELDAEAFHAKTSEFAMAAIAANIDEAEVAAEAAQWAEAAEAANAAEAEEAAEAAEAIHDESNKALSELETPTFCPSKPKFAPPSDIEDNDCSAGAGVCVDGEYCVRVSTEATLCLTTVQLIPLPTTEAVDCSVGADARTGTRALLIAAAAAAVAAAAACTPVGAVQSDSMICMSGDSDNRTRLGDGGLSLSSLASLSDLGLHRLH